jgi:hypothetical protein
VTTPAPRLQSREDLARNAHAGIDGGCSSARAAAETTAYASSGCAARSTAEASTATARASPGCAAA